LTLLSSVGGIDVAGSGDVYAEAGTVEVLVVDVGEDARIQDIS
jgi:hypothetical protein